MISFRYHVVSIVAVLLALAIGVALGSGPLQRETASATSPGLGKSLARARAQVATLRQGQAYDDAFVTATAARLVDGALDGRAVTVVTLPEAEATQVTAVTDMVAAAGGTVTAQVQVTPKLLDVGSRQLVAELAAQMEDAAKHPVDIPSSASGYQRMGLLLGQAVATTENGGSRPDQDGENILAGLATADLVTSEEPPDRRGSLVVVISGPPFGSADQEEGAGSIVTALVQALDRGSDGVVVAGPVAAGSGQGIVEAVRSTPEAARAVSTVDVVDQMAGVVTTVRALAEQAHGRSGQYGTTAAADGPYPS